MKKLFLALAISLVFFLPNISQARVTIGQPLMCQDSGSTNPADADPNASRLTLCSEIIAGSGPAVPAYFRLVGNLATQLQSVLTLTSSLTGVALTEHGAVTISGTFGYSAATNSFLPIPYVFPTDAIPRLTAGLATFPMNQFLTGADRWRSWRGAQMGSTNIANTTAAPWVGSIMWAQDDTGTFNKLRSIEFPLTFGTTDYAALVSASGMYFYNLTDAEMTIWGGSDANLAIPYTTELPEVKAVMMVDNGTDLGPAKSDADYNILTNQTAAAPGHSWDTDQDSATVKDIISDFVDGLATTLNGAVNMSVIFGLADDGALDMMKFDASGNIEMVDNTVRAGENVADNNRSIKVDDHTSPDVVTVSDTAVAGAADEVFPATDMSTDLHWTLTFTNVGGGSGDIFSDAIVYQSANGTSRWEVLTFTVCDPIASGVTCSYQCSNCSYQYIKAEVACAAGDTTVTVELSRTK